MSLQHYQTKSCFPAIVTDSDSNSNSSSSIHSTSPINPITESEARGNTFEVALATLETWPLLFGASAITVWEALYPGLHYADRSLDYLRCLPSVFMVWAATMYLVYHSGNCRWEWYTIEPWTRACLDFVRTSASCYILGIFYLAMGFKIFFFIAAYVHARDVIPSLSQTDLLLSGACVFLVLMYFVAMFSIGAWAYGLLMEDRARVKELETKDPTVDTGAAADVERAPKHHVGPKRMCLNMA